MPLKIRGSVRALLRVRFSIVSASRKESRSLENTSIPPGSMERNASSPWKRCNEARRLVPASVSTREPLGKSKAARFFRPASFAPGRPPVQASGNHQMKHQPEIALHPDSDALADAAQFPHHVTFHRGNRRPCRSQQKCASHTNLLERLPTIRGSNALI